MWPRKGAVKEEEVYTKKGRGKPVVMRMDASNRHIQNMKKKPRLSRAEVAPPNSDAFAWIGVGHVFVTLCLTDGTP